MIVFLLNKPQVRSSHPPCEYQRKRSNKNTVQPVGRRKPRKSAKKRSAESYYYEPMPSVPRVREEENQKSDREKDPKQYERTYRRTMQNVVDIRSKRSESCDANPR